MKKNLYSYDTAMNVPKAPWTNAFGQQLFSGRPLVSPQKFPWSKFLLPFLMMSSFLIFASTGLIDTGLHGPETMAIWAEQIGRIMTGTAIFGLAVIILITGVRLLLKNL